MQIIVEIPDQFVDSLIPGGSDPARILLEDSVAAAYRDRRIGPLQVRLLLGLETRMQVDDFLHKHQISGYTVGEFEKDMANLDLLRDSRKLEQPA